MQRRVLLLELVDAVEPLHAGRLLNQWVELPQHPRQVSNHRHVRMNVLAYLRGIHVHVDDPGVGGECANAAHYPVVEAHTKADDQVRLVDGQAGVGHPVHAGHPHEEHVGVREGAAA